jgi:hypothetical protein
MEGPKRSSCLKPKNKRMTGPEWVCNICVPKSTSEEWKGEESGKVTNNITELNLITHSTADSLFGGLPTHLLWF